MRYSPWLTAYNGVQKSLDIGLWLVKIWEIIGMTLYNCDSTTFPARVRIILRSRHYVDSDQKFNVRQSKLKEVGWVLLVARLLLESRYYLKKIIKRSILYQQMILGQQWLLSIRVRRPVEWGQFLERIVSKNGKKIALFFWLSNLEKVPIISGTLHIKRQYSKMVVLMFMMSFFV